MPEAEGQDDRSAQMKSPSYLLPVEGTQFLRRDEMRATRFALEYAKAELLLRDWGIRSTVIVFGSARVLSPEQLADARQAAVAAGDHAEPERLARRAAWYEAAREFGRIASERGGALSPAHRWRDNVIATGGGPGIMEAANRGAREAGAPSIGFNITLPDEQQPNAYITPELCFRFHYFAMRKMHLAMRARALAIFPGGFGTLDERFEILTLRQTRKSPPTPIVLFDKAYWTRVIDFEALLDEGMIAPAHLGLFAYAQTAEEVWRALARNGLGTFHGAWARRTVVPPARRMLAAKGRASRWNPAPTACATCSSSSACPAMRPASKPSLPRTGRWRPARHWPTRRSGARRRPASCARKSPKTPTGPSSSTS